MSKFSLPVTFDSANRKRDKSVSVRFTSSLEVSTEDFMELDRLLQQEGWLIFSPNELKPEDVPDTDAPTREGKSKGSRLRAVHFLIWQKLGIDEPFDPWYDRRFEQIMDKHKEKLD